jgi:hypothetical protein
MKAQSPTGSCPARIREARGSFNCLFNPSEVSTALDDRHSNNMDFSALTVKAYNKKRIRAIC